MQWETRKVLVTVKAYPEKSTKYGETVCVAGVTEGGDFIRLYPVHFNYFRGTNPIKKYTWIEVECKKNTSEKLQRKESYKIRDGTGIKIVSQELTKQPVNWVARNKILKHLVCDSIETLKDKFKEDKTSIGLIKVKDLLEFYSREPIDEIELEESKFVQASIFGGGKTPLQQIPHTFRYKFNCSDVCTGHDMNVEDWEVFESFRSWLRYYKGDCQVLWDKLKQRYETEMRNKDLHFFMGTDSQWGIWMIIGLYYPPATCPL